MSEKFRLANEFLAKLSDDELYLLISIVPEEKLLIPIKKYPKRFKNETKGCIIDKKSKILRSRLPKIYFNGIKRYDIDLINIVTINTNIRINTVINHIFKVTLDENFIKKTILSNNIDEISKLVNIILDKLEPEYVKLFFKLIDINLTYDQNDYLDIAMKSIILKNKLEREIKENVEREYKNKIIAIENKYKTEISNEIKKKREFEEELNHTKVELLYEKNKQDLIHKKIEETEKEKNFKIDVLQNCISKLNLTIDKIEVERFQLKNSLEENCLTIENLNKELIMKYDEYNFNKQEKWNIENQKLLNIRKNLNKECEDLKKAELELSNNIKSLENEKNQLENKIMEYKGVANRFIQNIDEKLLENALNNSLLKLNTKSYVQAENIKHIGNDLYIKDNQISNNIEQCENIFDFSENIAINLENIGIKSEADEIADYVIGILAAGMVPLICGYKAREIATAISASYSGETPYIITLPNGYTNSKELLQLYNLAQSNVVLIEDAVGTMNENSLMPLLRGRTQKEFLSKLILLSSENIDSIKYMPTNLFNQVALVMVNKYGISTKREYVFSDARKVLEEFSSLSDIKNEHRKISKLTYNLKFGSSYKLLRSIIVAYSSRISSIDVALHGYLKSELIFICRNNNSIEELEKNIQKNQLGDNLAKVIGDEVNE